MVMLTVISYIAVFCGLIGIASEVKQVSKATANAYTQHGLNIYRHEDFKTHLQFFITMLYCLLFGLYGVGLGEPYGVWFFGAAALLFLIFASTLLDKLIPAFLKPANRIFQKNGVFSNAPIDGAETVSRSNESR